MSSIDSPIIIKSFTPEELFLRKKEKLISAAKEFVQVIQNPHDLWYPALHPNSRKKSKNKTSRLELETKCKNLFKAAVSYSYHYKNSFNEKSSSLLIHSKNIYIESCNRFAARAFLQNILIAIGKSDLALPEICVDVLLPKTLDVILNLFSLMDLKQSHPLLQRDLKNLQKWSFYFEDWVNNILSSDSESESEEESSSPLYNDYEDIKEAFIHLFTKFHKVTEKPEKIHSFAFLFFREDRKDLETLVRSVKMLYPIKPAPSMQKIKDALICLNGAIAWRLKYWNELETVQSLLRCIIKNHKSYCYILPEWDLTEEMSNFQQLLDKQEMIARFLGSRDQVVQMQKKLETLLANPSPLEMFETDARAPIENSQALVEDALKALKIIP